jgi:hypothetical protein
VTGFESSFVGNELSEPALRQVLEILAGVLAAAGLLFVLRGR